MSSSSQDRGKTFAARQAHAPVLLAENAAAPSANEQWALEILHSPQVALTLRSIEELDAIWIADEPYPPRYGRYTSDETICGWSIPRHTAFYLYSLLIAAGTINALEVGTSFGYSTIWLASALCRNGGRITTCENFSKKMEIAGDFIRRSGLENITLKHGDAGEFMRQTDTTFDFVFLDADAAEYSNYLPWLRKYIAENGILAMDNALTHKDVVAEFVGELGQDPHWFVWYWPYDHGLVLARRTSAPA